MVIFIVYLNDFLIPDMEYGETIRYLLNASCRQPEDSKVVCYHDGTTGCNLKNINYLDMLVVKPMVVTRLFLWNGALFSACK